MYQAVNNLVGTTTEFRLYVYGLGIAGLISIFMGIAGFGATTGARVITVLVGVASLGYGVYLAFFDTSDTYTAYYYFLIIPLIAIINAIRSRGDKRQHQQQPPPPAV